MNTIDADDMKLGTPYLATYDSASGPRNVILIRNDHRAWCYLTLEARVPWSGQYTSNSANHAEITNVRPLAIIDSDDFTPDPDGDPELSDAVIGQWNDALPGDRTWEP